MSKERGIVSVHIEKTGGTSIEKFYKAFFGPDRVLLYNANLDTVLRSSENYLSRTNPLVDVFKYQLGKCPFLFFFNKLRILTQKYHPGQNPANGLPENFTIVHGHFGASRFDSQILDPIMAVVIRDPLDRMMSQFNHWKRARGRSERRKKLPFNPTVSFEDFCLMPELKNYQLQALEGKDLSEFELVGVTELLERFARGIVICARENKLVDSTLPRRYCGIDKLNVSPYSGLGVGKKFKEKFKGTHLDDYELYRQAVDIAFMLDKRTQTEEHF
jgi:hypothetical protein